MAGIEPETLGSKSTLSPNSCATFSSLSLLADKCNERENLVLKTATTLFHFFCLESDPDIDSNINFTSCNALIMTTPNSLTQKNLRSSSLVLKGIHETINEFKWLKYTNLQFNASGNSLVNLSLGYFWWMVQIWLCESAISQLGDFLVQGSCNCYWC